MAYHNQRRLTREEVQNLLTRLEVEMDRPECRSCECLRGFVAQLEFDAGEDAKPLLAKYKGTPREVRPCLGCEPCAPARIFAAYLMQKRKRDT